MSTFAQPEQPSWGVGYQYPSAAPTGSPAPVDRYAVAPAPRTAAPGAALGSTPATVTIRFGGHEATLLVAQKPGSKPAVVSMTDLGQQAGAVIDGVIDGVPALVTKRGRFVAVIVPVEPGAVEHYLFSGVSDLVDRRAATPREEPLAPFEETVARLGLRLPPDSGR
jgi:prevent-host-death family protein